MEGLNTAAVACGPVAATCGIAKDQLSVDETEEGLELAAFLASASQTPQSPSWADYSIFTRAWELAAGALVALSLPVAQRVDRRVAIPITWVGVALIVVAALAFDDSTPYPGSAALLPVAGAVAIIAAVRPSCSGMSFLNWRL